MNKEEILEKSRKENKNQDIYEKEIIKDGSNYGAIAAYILATVFFIIQIFTGGGINYGLYAILFTINAGQFIYKAIKIRRKHEIVLAVFYAIVVIMFSAAHIYNLITASAVI